MVRFENQAVKATPPVKGSYVYDHHTSLWDTVLKENQDRSFEKSDAEKKPVEKAAIEAADSPAMSNNTSFEEESAGVMIVAQAPPAAEIEEEKKCAEDGDEVVVALRRKVSVESQSTICSATKDNVEEELTEPFNAEGEVKHDQVPSPPVPDDEDGDEIEMEKMQNAIWGDDDDVKPQAEEENVPPAVKPVEDEVIPAVALNIVTESAEKVWAEKLKGKANPEMLSQLMAQIVADAAKKELEERLQKQKEEPEATLNTEEMVDIDLVALQETPMDAESLASAQAKLLEQAKSLAKAQALIQAQAKALAMMEQQQGKSPAATPARSLTSTPTTPAANIPKPVHSRSPSDESRLKTPKESQESSKATPFSALDVEWLAQAKSEAQAKAQALIRTAQAEAAARAEARRIAKERALAEERARQKEEVEAELKAKAVRDAWEFEQTQAEFRREEKERARARAEAKAAAEDKLRRKADTDLATANVMDAARAQAKAEAEYKIRLKADADAKFLEECKMRRIAERQARQEAVEKERAATRASADQPPSEEEIKRRKAEAEEKIRLKAEADAKWLEECKIRRAEEARMREEAMEKAKVAKEQEAVRAKLEQERQQKIKEMAAAQAKANAEHKIRLKAEADAKFLEECRIRRAKAAEQRAQELAEKQAEAKVRAKAMASANNNQAISPALNEQGSMPPHLCLMQTVPQTLASAKKLLLEPPREFVPFGKSKGEELDGTICLYLQVPGVEHASEIKVELEDGVLYISRGIILSGLDGVQKYTRSFPFEEALLDTHRISVTLIPANLTADGVSVLQFKLPKVQSTWNIPISLSEPEPEKQEEAEKDTEANPPSSDSTGEAGDDSKRSLDVPDDEVSVQQPSDEMKEEKTSDDEEAADSPGAGDPSNRKTSDVKDTGTHRIITIRVQPGFALEHISAVFGEESVRVVGNDGPRLSFRHVFPMNSKEVTVRQLAGSYDPESGAIVIKGPLAHWADSKSKARRIRVHKMEDPVDVSGVISVFHDDVSLTSSSRDNDSHANQSLSDKKKKGTSIKSLASKYLRLRPKKHKNEVP